MSAAFLGSTTNSLTGFPVGLGWHRRPSLPLKCALRKSSTTFWITQGKKLAAVFAQHYPQKQEVMLSISDFGVGIPFKVRKVDPRISDSAALEKAVVEGFTTKSKARNQGAGLNILTRYVGSNNRGRVFVQSLRGSFNCIYAASGPRMSARTEETAYPGTLIQITFRTDSLEPIGEKEEFEW